MNRTSKMGVLFQENMLLRKKVDYEKEYFLRRKKYKKCSSKGSNF